MPEWLTPDTIIWIASVVLGALGIKNAGPILAFIKGLLPKSDGKKQDDSSILPWFDDEERPPIYDVVDAYTILKDQADAKGHAECRRKLDEVLHHLLTDEPEPANG